MRESAEAKALREVEEGKKAEEAFKQKERRDAGYADASSLHALIPYGLVNINRNAIQAQYDLVYNNTKNDKDYQEGVHAWWIVVQRAQDPRLDRKAFDLFSQMMRSLDPSRR